MPSAVYVGKRTGLSEDGEKQFYEKYRTLVVRHFAPNQLHVWISLFPTQPVERGHAYKFLLLAGVPRFLPIEAGQHETL